MLAAGRPVTAVPAHLGPSTPAVTMSTYAHHIPEGEGAAGLLDGLLPLQHADATEPKGNVVQLFGANLGAKVAANTK